MTPETKQRLQSVYSHMKAIPQPIDYQRPYALPGPTIIDAPLASGEVCSLIPSAPIDVGFTGNPGLRIPDVEKFISSIGIEVVRSPDCPRYNPYYQRILIPPFAKYESPSAYYSDMFHELTHHSRGLDGHLKKKSEANFNFEEIVAQLGSELLMLKFGLDGTEATAAYVNIFLFNSGGDRRVLYNKAARCAIEAVEKLELISLGAKGRMS